MRCTIILNVAVASGIPAALATARQGVRAFGKGDTRPHGEETRDGKYGAGMAFAYGTRDAEEVFDLIRPLDHHIRSKLAEFDYPLRPADWSYDSDGDATILSPPRHLFQDLSAHRSPAASDTSSEEQHATTTPSTESSIIFTQPHTPPSTPSPLPPPFQPPTTIRRRPRMTTEVGTFRGDGSVSDQDPQVFFDKCRAVWIEAEPPWEFARQLEWFEIKLERNSEARAWFETAKQAGIGSAAALKSAFDTEYPPKPTTVKTVQDKWDRLQKHVETLTMANMLNRDKDGAAEYINWAATFDRLSKGIADTGGLLATQIRNKLPPPLKKLVDPPASFADLATKVQGVSRTRLEEEVEAENKMLQLTELVEKGLRTRTAPAAPARNATSTPQTAGAQGSNGQPRSQAGFGAFGARRFSRHTAEDQDLRLRPQAQRRTDYERTKLRRATTEEEYQRQVAEYERANPGLLPTEQRPYPLSPGTADSGTGECYECGYAHRRNEDHRGPKLKFEETNYRRMAGVVTNANGGRQPTQISLVDLYEIMRQQFGEREQTAVGANMGDADVQGNGDGASV
ncbi:hypothetical protein HWV62_1134 [Athelia sp. TMB]|nr:hypothetical protein HWV62_1134 [Athelia sp. TMB]